MIHPLLSYWASCPLAERRNLPAESAVYAVVAPDDVVDYVGASGNLRRRFNQQRHHRAEQFDPESVIYFARTDVESVGLFELEYIERLQPRLDRWPVLALRSTILRRSNG